MKDISFSGDLPGAIPANEAQQAVAKSILAQTSQSNASITECTGQTLAEARELAYGIQTGKQIALAPAAFLGGVAYYAACTTINAFALADAIGAVYHFGNSSWTWSGVLSATVCLPVTATNLAIVYSVGMLISPQCFHPSFKMKRSHPRRISTKFVTTSSLHQKSHFL